ncbi:hypothetical protein P6U16_24330 (plasmid) [Rhizobium sp. 32-5/1]|uniref:hypothetical protein n=1 Tax=Rhizobium sp. 32-5/1 TaxID=3019602 RepID=UPI00240E59B0|nr:hypothetical protein [Rhizobium sp. 32-5/1]WEZ85282.1 hypothetical protein P6U16_24330 [Rhizobium sp. 32-5/1]
MQSTVLPMPHPPYFFGLASFTFDFQTLAHPFRIFKACGTVAESPLFETDGRGFRNVVTAPQIALGLAPEIPASLDVVAIGDEGLRMIDPSW